MCDFNIDDLIREQAHQRQKEEEEKHAADCCCVCCGARVERKKKNPTDYVSEEELATLDYRYRVIPQINNQIERYKLVKSMSLLRNKPLNAAWNKYMNDLNVPKRPVILSTKKHYEFRLGKLQLQTPNPRDSYRMTLTGRYDWMDNEWAPTPTLPDPFSNGRPKDYLKKLSISTHPKLRKEVQKNDKCCLFPSCN